MNYYINIILSRLVFIGPTSWQQSRPFSSDTYSLLQGSPFLELEIAEEELVERRFGLALAYVESHAEVFVREGADLVGGGLWILGSHECMALADAGAADSRWLPAVRRR